MMKSHQVLFILTGFLFSLGSCTKEFSYENPALNQSGSGNFYATIDGEPWQADSLQMAIVADSGIVTITGISKTQDEISMVLPGFQKGVYAVNGQSVGFALFTSLQVTAADLYLTNTSTDASKAGGTVSLTTIDTVNKTISGTFQFNLYQETNMTTKTVTGGVFNNIPYTGVVSSPSGPPVGDSADTLIATIDSVNWNASQISVVPQGGVLVIIGFSADGQQSMALSMPESVSAGTYTLDVNSGIYMAYYIDGLTTFVSEGNGSLTVIANDTVNKRINGRFNFVGASQTDNSSDKITNGYFSVKY
jgi:hypothetical protein